MISNLSPATSYSKKTDPFVVDSNLPFNEYIAHCRFLIETRRGDMTQTNKNHIIDANSPFELFPTNPILSGKRLKYGALLIHGLLDCPFSLRDIGYHLQARGILSRSVLLPGHGTNASDLLPITYHDWIKSVQYGIESLKEKVEQLFLIGYSTGAALSIYHALHDSKIKGIVLLAPAIQIKAPVNIVVGWHYLLKYITRDNKEWLYSVKETDYVKYRSIPFNAIYQVSRLTKLISKLRQHQSLACPMLMVMSREDETISSYNAINFFSSYGNQDSKLLLYSALDRPYKDSRILIRNSSFPELNIHHFSHVSIPIAPHNPHYGQHGDYLHASHIHLDDTAYGAYNSLEEDACDTLYSLGLLRHKRHELTYNPDFDFTAERILAFLLRGE